MTGLLFGLFGAAVAIQLRGRSLANCARTRSCFLRSSAGRKISTQAEPIRSAGTLVSASVGRRYHSLVPRSDVGEDGHTGLWSAAGVRAGS
jgi:hypothetical protein